MQPETICRNEIPSIGISSLRMQTLYHMMCRLALDVRLPSGSSFLLPSTVVPASQKAHLRRFCGQPPLSKFPSASFLSLHSASLVSCQCTHTKFSLHRRIAVIERSEDCEIEMHTWRQRCSVPAQLSDLPKVVYEAPNSRSIP